MSREYAEVPRRGRSTGEWIVIALGLGALLLVGTCGLGAVALVAIGSAAPEGESGVVLGEQVPDDVVADLEARGLVARGEPVIAYYDATITLDRSEVAVLTAERLTVARGKKIARVSLADIATIDHRRELGGDVIEVATDGGKRMRVEVAPLNDGVAFLNALTDEVRRKRPDVQIRSRP